MSSSKAQREITAENENRIKELCPLGITDQVIQNNLPHLEPQQRAMAINKLDLLRNSSGLLYGLKDSQSANEEDTHLRVVLVGKTGAGKSASGNTILGEKRFKSMPSTSSLTAVCKKETGKRDTQMVAVVDTPGLYDTNRSQYESIKEITRCISFIAPGPHVFLVVIQLGRFTQEEQETVKLIQEMFGEKAAEYTMVLFTRGDDLEADGVSVEEAISGNKALQDFIGQCGRRYHVFNNRAKNPSQVRELLKKIDMMVQQNGGRYYTNTMLEEAEKAIREKQELILKENPDMKPEDARKQAEEDNPFIKAVLIGAGIGAVCGAPLGPVGAAVGAAVGAGVGAAVVGIKKLKAGKKCVIQ